MGYSSDVAYLIRGPKDTMLGLLAQIRVGDDDTLKNALKETIISDRDAARYVEASGDWEDEPTITIAFSVTGIKWYASYLDVQMHDNLWAFFSAAQEDGGDQLIDGSFIRVGEENPDIEEKSFGENIWDLNENLSLCINIRTDGTVFDTRSDIREEARCETPA